MDLEGGTFGTKTLRQDLFHRKRDNFADFVFVPAIPDLSHI